MTTSDGSDGRRPELEGLLAIVLAPAANSMFRLRMLDGREVVAHAAKDLRMAFTRLLPGDQVLVDLSAFDPNKARIRKLLKSTQPSQHERPPNQPQQRELS
jgi:translation initiation factor IF-1